MAKIVSLLKPFELKQQIYVYENGNKLDFIESNLEELELNILNFQKKYDVKVLELAGPKQYSKGIAKKIQEEELNKYNKNILEIHFL